MDVEDAVIAQSPERKPTAPPMKRPMKGPGGARARATKQSKIDLGEGGVEEPEVAVAEDDADTANDAKTEYLCPPCKLPEGQGKGRRAAAPQRVEPLLLRILPLREGG